MKKKKAKTAGQKHRAKVKAKAKLEEMERGNWVEDRLDWVDVVDRHGHDLDDETGDEVLFNAPSRNDVDNSDLQTSIQKVDGNFEKDLRADQSKQQLLDFSIISWNVLADAYCSRSSHKNLPPKFQSRVFNRNQRQHQIRQTLRLFVSKLSLDIITLQEVDPPLEVAKCMRSLGYGVVETIGSSGGRAGRVDSCGLYFREDNWKCLNHETVRLDDLAILRSSSESDDRVEKNHNEIKNKRRRNDNGDTQIGRLKGFERSFVRKNVTLLARMEHKLSRRQVVIVVSHLFWNPAYDYVKLCQAHYVAIRANAFCKRHDDIPFVWCGDFNSQPQGYVHQYLTKGVVNAKAAAPWYARSHKRHEEQKANVNLTGTGHQELTDQFDLLNMAEETIENKTESKDVSTPKVKYLLDSTLNRFCRWLRILGLNAALETEEEEKERTRDGKITIFQRCRDEGRSLVTTASKLINRKDCPPGTYLLDTKSLLNLESAVVHLLLSHGVELEPNKMLTRCVVCNGSIEPVYDEDRRRGIFKSHQAPDESSVEGLDVFQCNGCSQGYWWCEKPNSSASRVKCQATRLLELCIRGGVPIDNDLGMFSKIDVKKIRATKDEMNKENELVEERLDVVQWLQEEDLKNPLPSMTSAYALKGTQKESLAFTNVTYDFVGNLDYILYQSQAMKVTDLLFVPKTFGELNDFNISNGHLLPSYDWPSDHLAIGCRISFRPVLENIEKEKDQSFKSLKSGPIPFPPGPPLAVPWCGFIDESNSVSEQRPEEASITSRTTVVSEEAKDDSESDSVSEPAPKEASITSRNTVVSEETKGASTPHGERCGCGCVPNVPSLFEMAELRRQYRLKLKDGGA